MVRDRSIWPVITLTAGKVPATNSGGNMEECDEKSTGRGLLLWVAGFAVVQAALLAWVLV